jgi:hypothetical protein
MYRCPINPSGDSMTQTEYDQLTELASDAISMYNAGLITLPELVKAMGNLDFRNAAGLIDTQSGLRID